MRDIFCFPGFDTSLRRKRTLTLTQQHKRFIFIQKNKALP